MKNKITLIIIISLITAIFCSYVYATTLTSKYDSEVTLTDENTYINSTDDSSTPKELPPTFSRQNIDIDIDKLFEEYTFEYSFYPTFLIDYIGHDRFMEWIENSEIAIIDEDQNVSLRNITTCLKYFNISQAEFENLYYSYGYYTLIYDTDIMYHGTDGEIDAYFRDIGGRNQEYDSRINIFVNKVALRNDLSKWTQDTEIIEKYNTLPLGAWTFSDIIAEANIPRSDVEAIFEGNETYDSYTGEAKFNIYDIDAIYEAASQKKNNLYVNNLESAIDVLNKITNSNDYCKKIINHEKQYYDIVLQDEKTDVIK